MRQPREISQSEYEAEVIGSTVPVLLDVYGEHCGPCRQLAPTIDRLAREYEGRAKVLKVEAGTNRELAGGLADDSRGDGDVRQADNEQAGWLVPLHVVDNSANAASNIHPGRVPS
jgi:thiol-disulfide isomerase/thioredoxin